MADDTHRRFGAVSLGNVHASPQPGTIARAGYPPAMRAPTAHQPTRTAAWQISDRLVQPGRQRMTSHLHSTSASTLACSGWSFYARFYGWRFS